MLNAPEMSALAGQENQSERGSFFHTHCRHWQTLRACIDLKVLDDARRRGHSNAILGSVTTLSVRGRYAPKTVVQREMKDLHSADAQLSCFAVSGPG